MPALNARDTRIFSGRSHPKLAADIAAYLSLPLDPTHYDRFSNDNLYIQLGASVRSRIVFIVQSLTPPVSDHLLELFMMLDIARSAGASEVHAIIPYFSYARSDKKDAPRISITARLVADLLQTAGATHIMTMTLHSPQVHGFFSVPTDPLTARHLFADYFRNLDLNPKDCIVVSPDAGRAKAAARFADMLRLPSAAANKERLSDQKVVIDDSIARQVAGFHRALIYDDEIANGTTVLELSGKLLTYGIQQIYVICTHGLFASNSLEKISAFPGIVQIVTTDTVPMPEERRTSKLTVLPVGPVFGEAIWRNVTRQSIGDLFSHGADDDEKNHLDEF
jgi:ribose-phosphate pyrophosphokinase